MELHQCKIEMMQSLAQVCTAPGVAPTTLLKPPPVHRSHLGGLLGGQPLWVLYSLGQGAGGNIAGTLGEAEVTGAWISLS